MTIDGGWSCRRARQRLCDLCVGVCCKMFVCRHTGHSHIVTLLCDGAALICVPPNNEEKPIPAAVCDNVQRLQVKPWHYYVMTLSFYQ